jgi:PLAT/LH2 domain
MSINVRDAAYAAVFGPDLDCAKVEGHSFNINKADITQTGDRNAYVAGTMTRIRSGDFDAHYLYRISIEDAKVTELNVTKDEDSLFDLGAVLSPIINRLTGSKIPQEDLDKLLGEVRRLSENDVAKEVALLIITYISLFVRLRAENNFPPLASYLVTVRTESDEDAGTDANPYIRLHGVEEMLSDEKRLLGSKLIDNYNAGSVETIRLDVHVSTSGNLNGITVGHDNDGEKPGWLVESVTIELDTGRQWTFVYNNWIAEGAAGVVYTTDGIETRRLLPAGATMRYSITIKTSDVDSAGTDANVWLMLIGANGQTRPVMLTQSGVNNFERGREDHFDFEEADVGPLERLVIGHDSAGEKSGWHFDYIKVMKGDKALVCRWGKWLAVNTPDPEGQVVRDGPGVRTVELPLVPERPQRAAVAV